ncbi:MAG: hypothetical protein ACE10K_12640 [Rhodothermales bacterium]
MNIARLLLLMPLVLVLATLAPSVSRAQEANDDPAASLAERLGYPSDARLLLVHMDDIGVAHSVNQASIDALSTPPSTTPRCAPSPSTIPTTAPPGANATSTSSPATPSNNY